MPALQARVQRLQLLRQRLAGRQRLAQARAPRLPERLQERRAARGLELPPLA